MEVDAMMVVSMRSSYIIIILGIILVISISSVFASGLDSGDNITEEEHDSYVDGYDAGFAEIMTAIELANVMKKKMMSIMNLGLTLVTMGQVL
jgi:hypothetical protein